MTALFGGAFDPVHNAHLEVARAAADTFGLRRILFVPGGRPPFKGEVQAAWQDRMNMLQLAIADAHDARFEASAIEDPATHPDRPSYSIDTVEKLLAAGYGPLAFIIGADAFADIRKWRRWQELTKRVEFIVAPRPGSSYVVPEGAKVHELRGPVLPDSSSRVRAALREDRNDVEVPGPVLRYIREHGLYRSQTR